MQIMSRICRICRISRIRFLMHRRGFGRPRGRFPMTGSPNILLIVKIVKIMSGIFKIYRVTPVKTIRFP